MECCALRVSEACGIEPGDLDFGGGMILIRRSVTKTKAGRRWVPVPGELLDALAVRGGVGVTPSNVYYDLQKACERGKIRPFGTHAFRHRRASLWLRQGIDAVQVARWAGHSKPSESTDTYGHTVVDALADEWLGFWQAAYGPRGAAPVRHEEVAE
jgi:integrase